MVITDIVRRGKHPVEAAATLLGWAIAPVFGVATLLRRARVLHPRGDLALATVEPLPGAGEHRALAERLRGRALLRLSASTFKREGPWPDVLGCAIRFLTADPAVAPTVGDQDLLFATIRRPWTLMFAFLTTRARDYLKNDYYAISPFSIDGEGRHWLRLRSERVSTRGSSRRERLATAIGRGAARFFFEIAPSPRGPFRPIAEVRIERLLDLDEEIVRFDPFRAGRGLEPRGAIHALRRGAYAVSHAARGLLFARRLRVAPAAV